MIKLTLKVYYWIISHHYKWNKNSCCVSFNVSFLQKKLKQLHQTHPLHQLAAISLHSMQIQTSLEIRLNSQIQAHSSVHIMIRPSQLSSLVSMLHICVIFTFTFTLMKFACLCFGLFILHHHMVFCHPFSKVKVQRKICLCIKWHVCTCWY